MKSPLLIQLVSIYLMIGHVANAQSIPVFFGEGFSAIHHNPATYGQRYQFEANSNLLIQYPAILSTDHVSTLINAAYRKDFEKNSRLSVGTGLAHYWEQFSVLRNHIIQLPVNLQLHFEKINFSAGIAVGTNYLAVPNYWFPVDTLDPRPADGNKKTAFYNSAGLSVWNKRFYAGLAVTNLIKPNFYGIYLSSYRTFSAQAGYQIPIGKFFIYPMADFYFQDGFTMANAKVYFQLPKEIWSFGAGYTFRSGLMAGLRVKCKNAAISYHFMKSSVVDMDMWFHDVRISFLLKEIVKK